MVSQCCCGCSLRTGTLILLWLSVFSGVFTPIWNWTKLSDNAAYDKIRAGPTDKQLFKIHLFITIFTAIIGLITAIIGLYAIHKNKPKYLEPFLYYYGLEIGYYVLFMLVAVFYPKLYLCMMSSEALQPLGNDYAVTGILTFLILMGLMAYFWVVIKSYRDSMLENAAGNNATAATNSYSPPPYCDKA